eukprot:scaffold449304_cov18-Prasinocladus_malaysianus.AAC.1
MQRRRGDAAEQDARDAQERATRLAAAVEAETTSYVSLVSTLARLRECKGPTKAKPMPEPETDREFNGLCCGGICSVTTAFNKSHFCLRSGKQVNGVFFRSPLMSWVIIRLAWG